MPQFHVRRCERINTGWLDRQHTIVRLTPGGSGDATEASNSSEKSIGVPVRSGFTFVAMPKPTDSCVYQDEPPFRGEQADTDPDNEQAPLSMFGPHLATGRRKDL
jgi:hypothetical protein